MMAEVAENQLRDYVMGALPEAEQAALEEVLLKDRSKFEAAWALENDLVDRYVRNQMPAPERTQFERHYLVSPRHRERVATAEALLYEIDESPISAPKTISWWQRWRESWRAPQLVFSGAMAVALLLTLGGAWWLVRERAQLSEQLAQVRSQAQAEAERRAAQLQQSARELAQEQLHSQQLKAELEKLPQRKETVAPPVLLSFLLTSATRDRNSSPAVIPRNVRNPQLLMERHDTSYADYQATLQTVEGRALSSFPARLTSDRAFIGVTLPTTRLTRGDYVLILSGRTDRGGVEETDRYFFRVQ